MSSAFTPTSPLRQRFRPLWWLAITYLAISFATRVVLLVMSGSEVPHTALNLLYAFGVGLGYDLVTCIYVAWPLVLLLWIVPTRSGRMPGLWRWLLSAAGLVLACAICLGVLHLMYHATLKTTWPALLPFLFVLPLTAFTYTSRAGQWVLYGFALLLLYGLLFVAASELVFWNEFSVRFNFIAVDYLVYTTEVIGNIRESYPIGRWLTLLAALALVLFALGRRALRVRDDGSRFWQRGKVALLWLVLTVVSVAAVNGGMKDRTGNNYVNELAGNGIYQFFNAFRSSHLDYAKFYRTLPDDEAFRRVREMLKTPEASYVSDDPRDLTRTIRHAGPEKRLNVVLISVESLSGDYLGTFGNQEKITPYLDALAGQSLFFDNLYANGTRTVRGLEALALSVPPTPGDSLLKERGNENLFSLASVFNDRGYQSDFVYGGYGEFDNMNYFFSHNGYRAVDRRDIPKTATIHRENVWGVADEDLYTLAMGQMDQIAASGKPFFLHIMTTSNHRPFTFPEGRVKQANGTRQGAVAYTDWAIGDFIRRARAKPYFDDTVFVITADHCASSAGKTSVPVNRYHVPLWIYAPKHIQPRRVDRLMGQVDIAPTLLGLLNFSYRSRFFGYDLFQLEPGRERAFPATYEKLGYLHEDVLTVLEPGRKLEQMKPDYASGDAVPLVPQNEEQIAQTIAYYQVASELFKRGQLLRRPTDATPVEPLPAAPGSVPASAGSTVAPAAPGSAPAPAH
ncbi:MULTISPECIES: LTA synthase family protein [Rhodanobacter]|uniref:LTA synthase family protein n=1 Tax=Rhodanobacter TaxID=75309 RepID=UPI0003F992CF|nr:MULTISPECIES: LTA synthase family protein [Rhodanobacter]UJJ59876.1 sulfatase-like hydrolase/transferase [Rhodanobacter denitrificans]